MKKNFGEWKNASKLRRVINVYDKITLSDNRNSFTLGLISFLPSPSSPNEVLLPFERGVDAVRDLPGQRNRVLPNGSNFKVCIQNIYRKEWIWAYLGAAILLSEDNLAVGALWMAKRVIRRKVRRTESKIKIRKKNSEQHSWHRDRDSAGGCFPERTLEGSGLEDGAEAKERIW